MSVAGIWYNELGSRMVLDLDDNYLSGSYHSAVGPVQGEFVLSGLIYPRSDGNSLTLGFTVVWKNAETDVGSATSWSGQWQRTDDSEEQIMTMWLLTLATAADDDWEAFRTGQDVFTRREPTPVAVRRARKSKA